MSNVIPKPKLEIREGYSFEISRLFSNTPVLVDLSGWGTLKKVLLGWEILVDWGTVARSMKWGLSTST
jgi:hypothetical protein